MPRVIDSIHGLSALSCAGARRLLRGAVPMLLCLITAIVFWPTLHFGFVDWDDPIEVLTNPYVEGLTWTNLKGMFTNYDRVRRYHPLDWLGWAVNYQIDGRRPFGYHLGNLLEHLATVVLVYLLVLKLLRLWQDASRPRALGDAPPPQYLFTFAAAAGTLWWAIHPLRAEPVAWVTGRIYTQCAMFLAACLLCYVASREQGLSGAARRVLYMASVSFFVGSLLSHAITVGAAAVIFLLDIYPLRRFSGDGANRWWDARARRIYVEKIPFVAAALAVGLITLWARVDVTLTWKPPPTFEQFPLFARTMQAFYTYAYYLWAPWTPSHLSPIYTRLVRFHPTDAIFVGSLVVALAVSLLAILSRKVLPWLPVMWAYHLIVLAPVLGLTEYPHYTSDRYAHVQGFLFAVLIAGVIVSACMRVRGPRTLVITSVVTATILGSMAALCNAQVRIWRDSETLFRYMLAELGADPYRADIHWRLGKYYIDQDQLGEAVSALDRALRIAPDNPYALHFKGIALIGLADGERRDHPLTQDTTRLYLEAAFLLERAMTVKFLPQSLVAAATAYAHARRFDRAEERLRLALEVEPHNADLRLRLGRVNYEQGKIAAAIAELDRVIQGSPGLAPERQRILTDWAAANAGQPPRP